MKITLPSASALSLLWLAACAGPTPRLAVAPDVVSDHWADAEDIGQDAPRDFWQGFESPTLSALVERAAADNASLDAARARVQRARGELRVAGAALLPTIGASANISKTRTDNVGGGLFNNSAGSAGLDIGYDLDLFGGARAGRRAAGARARATAFDADSLALVVRTDAARGYIQWLVLGERLAIADRGLGNTREIVRIVGVRRAEGIATGVDTGLANGELAQLEANRTSLVEARSRTQAALALLVGAEAPSFRADDIGLQSLAIPSVALGQPSDLLYRRPDIRAAEARIAAANGDVAQARAAFKPTLRLTASALGQAAAFGGPYGSTLSIGAGLLAPIFQGGRLRGQLEAASANQVESVALYRDVVLRALSEGQQALAGLQQAHARVGILSAAAEEASEAAALSRLQYVEGSVDISDLIQAQRNSDAINDAWVLARQDELLALIDLYKALGGDPAAPQTSALSFRY